MSKAKLHKELDTFTKDQLIELVLNVYDSSKDAKAYFEFFLNPDADALFNKKIEAIAKEIGRSKYGYAKMRVTKIKDQIKSFANFGVGDERVGELTLQTLRMLVGMERHLNYTTTHYNFVEKLTREYIDISVRIGNQVKGLERLAEITDVHQLGTQYIRNKMKGWIDSQLKELKIYL